MKAATRSGVLLGIGSTPSSVTRSSTRSSRPSGMRPTRKTSICLEARSRARPTIVLLPMPTEPVTVIAVSAVPRAFLIPDRSFGLLRSDEHVRASGSGAEWIIV